MKTKTIIIPHQPVEDLIHTLRGQRVILDTDLAQVYGVLTWRLNEQVKRNQERFPADFMFQLTDEENKSLTSQFAMSKKGRGGRRTLPYAFTEHGAIMAANVLNSPRAVQMSVFVVRAFVKMREMLGDNRHLAEKLAELEPSSTFLTKSNSSWSHCHPRRNRNAVKLDFMFATKSCQNFVAAGARRARVKRRWVMRLKQKKVRASSRRLLH
jgi:hypothetical protein